MCLKGATYNPGNFPTTNTRHGRSGGREVFATIHKTHIPLILHDYCKLTSDVHLYGTRYSNNNFISLSSRHRCLFYLSRAFDTVNHGIFMKKLEHYSIRGAFLDGSGFILRANGNAFHKIMLDLKCGNQHGSILGTPQFLLYVNEISKTTSLLHFIMFADDTNVFMSCTSTTEIANKINSELEKVDIWFKANKISLNLYKTSYILFYTRREQMFMCMIINTVKADKHSITRVASSKSLRVHIDELLS